MATPTTPAKAGDRVELVHCNDPYATIKPGTLGTVTLIDDLGTTHVHWDNGNHLGLINGEDTFIVIGTDA